MMFFLSLMTIFSVHAADFPECEKLFIPLDEQVAHPTADLDAAKKTLFKIANDKRLEVLRFVRDEKATFRKAKDEELTAFDVQSKKNPSPTSDERTKRRKEREELSKKINKEKKDFNKALDDQQKACNDFLNTQRSVYLAKFRAIKNAPKSTNHNKDAVAAQQTIHEITDHEAAEPARLAKPKKADMSEFDEIPKGPGTVLKPQ